MKKKLRNVVFAMLAIVCMVASNITPLTAYALDSASGDDIRTFQFDVTYEGTRIEGTTIEIFEMDFASASPSDQKYVKIAEGTTVVSCELNLTQLLADNKFIYTRFSLPEGYEFSNVEVDENGAPTDIQTDYCVYAVDELEAYPAGSVISFEDVMKKEPQTPDIPSTPGTPSTPDTPSTPEVPSTPDTPSTPDAPSTPDTPDAPSTPSTPSTPDAPNTPDAPSTPSTPEVPGTSDTGKDSVTVVTPGTATTGQWNDVSTILKGNETGKVNVQKDASASTVVEKEVLSDIFHTMKDTKKDVTFSFADEDGNTAYSWSFAGSDITKPDATILDFKVESNAKIDEVESAITATGTDGQYETVHFAHEGDLPGTATVTTKVDLPDQKVYFYYYNPVTRFLELVSDQAVVQNGYATFQIEHCSDYVLSTKKLDTEAGKNPEETPQNPSTPDANPQTPSVTEQNAPQVKASSAPDTADMSNGVVPMTIGLLAGAALLFMNVKKEKNQE